MKNALLVLSLSLNVLAIQGGMVRIDSGAGVFSWKHGVWTLEGIQSVVKGVE